MQTGTPNTKEVSRGEDEEEHGVAVKEEERWTRRGRLRREITGRRYRGRGVAGRRSARACGRRRKRTRRRQWRGKHFGKTRGGEHREEGVAGRAGGMTQGGGLANQQLRIAEKEHRRNQIRGERGERRHGVLRATGPVSKASRGSRRRRRARVATRRGMQGVMKLVIGILVLLLVCSADATGDAGNGQEMGMLSTVGTLVSMLVAYMIGRRGIVTSNENQSGEPTHGEGTRQSYSNGSESGGGLGSGNGSGVGLQDSVQDDWIGEVEDEDWSWEEEEANEERPTWFTPARPPETWVFVNTTVPGRYEQPYDKQIWVYFHDLNWPDMILPAHTGREPVHGAVRLGTDALHSYQLEYPRWGVNVIEFEPSREHRLGGIRCIGGDIVNIAAGHRSERSWLVMVLKHSEQEECQVEVWIERMTTALGRESIRRREKMRGWGGGVEGWGGGWGGGGMGGWVGGGGGGGWVVTAPGWGGGGGG